MAAPPVPTAKTTDAAARWWLGIFLLRYPERFVGKHILIVDDVLTTGATTTACADALKDVGGVHVSILTLAVAGS